MNNGIICKDKGIEKYALENYGRLSGMTTIGIIVTALTEYRPLPEQESKSAEEILCDLYCAKNIDELLKHERPLEPYKILKAMKKFNAQSHPEAREISDDKVEAKIKALQLQKEQRGYNIKEVMLYIDGFKEAIKWFKSQLK